MSVPNPLAVSDIHIFLGRLSNHLKAGGKPVDLTWRGEKIGTIMPASTTGTQHPKGFLTKLVAARELLLSAQSEAWPDEHFYDVQALADDLDKVLQKHGLCKPRPASIPGGP